MTPAARGGRPPAIALRIVGKNAKERLTQHIFPTRHRCLQPPVADLQHAELRVWRKHNIDAREVLNEGGKIKQDGHREELSEQGVLR
jgi:hypothetical protein